MRNRKLLRAVCAAVLVASCPVSALGTYELPSDISNSLLFTGYHDYGSTVGLLYHLGPSEGPGNVRLIARWYFPRIGDSGIDLYSPTGGGLLFYEREYSSEPGFYEYTPPSEESPDTAEIHLWEANAYGSYHRFRTKEYGSGPLPARRFDMLDGPGGNFTLASVAGASYALFTSEPATGAQNVSNRVCLHPDDTAISGFVVGEWRWVLVRGIGPSLAEFGVENVVPDVTVGMYQGENLIASNEGWGERGPDSEGLSIAFDLAGAFALEEGSNDSALFLLVESGSYTIHVNSPSMTEPGEVLIEVYILPFGLH